MKLNKFFYLGIILAFALVVPSAAGDVGSLSADDVRKGKSLLAGVSSQTATTLANYYGCRQWIDSVCQECSTGFTFNARGVCCAIPQLCKTYNTKQGKCQECYMGYIQVDGVCTKPSFVPNPRDFCITRKVVTEACTKCAFRSVLLGAECVEVDVNCAEWQVNGVCDKCYPGYLVNSTNNKVCRERPILQSVLDPLCAQWNFASGFCAKCSDRSVLQSNGRCLAVDLLCKTWSITTAECINCFAGYKIEGRTCIPLTADEIKQADKFFDVGCTQWDLKTSLCVKCSTRWIFSNVPVKTCVPVSDSCLAYNEFTGACTLCYKGFTLSNTKCVPATITDLGDGCRFYTVDGKSCSQCQPRFYLSNNKCVQVDTYCQTWSLSTGTCIKCFPGYINYNGLCLPGSVLDEDPSKDCVKYNWDTNECLACNPKSYLTTDGCRPVSDSCKTFNSDNGQCVDCFSGYINVDGVCTLEELDNPAIAVGCRKLDSTQRGCLECAKGFFAESIVGLNGLFVCYPMFGDCLTYGTNGLCINCLPKYKNIDGVCVYENAPVTSLTELGCLGWDPLTKVCTGCAKGFMMNNQGRCMPLNTYCRTYTSAGDCETCFLGYEINRGVCSISTGSSSNSTFVGCKTFSSTGECLECAPRWVRLGSRCIGVRDECKGWKADGTCSQCYQGYQLRNGVCQILDELLNPNIDYKCTGTRNGICLACAAGYYLLLDFNRCVSYSDLCKTLRADRSCDTCYDGYTIRNGNCVVSVANSLPPADTGCRKWDNGNCVECAPRFWYNTVAAKCVQVDGLCKEYNLNTGVCTKCYIGYTLLARGQCILTTPSTNENCNSYDAASGACTKCSRGFYFSSTGACAMIPNLCQVWDFASRFCRLCYAGYALDSLGNCQRQSTLCASYDINTLQCNRCVTRAYLDSNNRCVLNDENCIAFDTTGRCSSCAKGYDLNGQACVLKKDATIAMPGCMRWNWDTNTCLQCAPGFKFDINQVCKEMDATLKCKTYTPSGLACMECYKGFTINDGKCVETPSLCRTEDNNGCISCYEGYVLYDKVCQPIAALSTLYLYYNKCCPEKLAELEALLGLGN